MCVCMCANIIEQERPRSRTSRIMIEMMMRQMILCEKERQKDKKTNRQKDKNTNRPNTERPKRERRKRFDE